MTETIETPVAWVGLGVNVGRRGVALMRLRETLISTGGMRIEAASRELLTRAVDVTAQPDFHNQVVRLRATRPHAPLEWLALCQTAEQAAGRRTTYRSGPRRADADILLLGPDGDIRVDLPQLHVPHDRLAERPFLCALLAELAPGLRHPDGWPLRERAGHFAAA